jgi:Ca2+-binding EF-hand superfamily protein
VVFCGSLFTGITRSIGELLTDAQLEEMMAEAGASNGEIDYEKFKVIVPSLVRPVFGLTGIDS